MPPRREVACVETGRVGQARPAAQPDRVRRRFISSLTFSCSTVGFRLRVSAGGNPGLRLPVIAAENQALGDHLTVRRRLG